MSEAREPGPRPPESRPDDRTTLHVRRAEAGDPASLEWVVTRFSPLLLAQAAYRLGPRLRPLYDPEDVVNDVWAVALPRFRELSEREGRATPVLLRFLATTLLYRVNDLVSRHISRGAGPVARAEAGGGGPTTDPVARLLDERSSVVSRLVKREALGAVLAGLEELEPLDRQILILRGIEQASNQTAALLLGIEPKAASMRYARALARLRSRLPDSLFDELSPD